MIVDLLTGYYYDWDKIEVIILFLLLTFLNTFYFKLDKKYVKINTKYKSLSRKESQANDIFILLVLLTIITVFVYLSIMRHG